MACPVCYEEFTDERGIVSPRILPCMHVVCNGCCEDQIDGTTLCCPLCFAEHTVSLPLHLPVSIFHACLTKLLAVRASS